MSILDDLIDIARERHFGHETPCETERPVCRISKIPIAWCGGCRKGFHKYTHQPLIGSEPEEPSPSLIDVDLAAAPVEGIKKIWADGELVYDKDRQP